MPAVITHKLFGSEDLLLIICLTTASKVRAGYFARLSKGIGGATRNTYPFATTKARSCEGYSDAGRQSLRYFILSRFKRLSFCQILYLLCVN